QEQSAAAGARLAQGGGPLILLLAGGAAAALGLYAFAVALNDLLDVKRDRLLRPERPLASGQRSERAGARGVAVTLRVATRGAAVLIYNAAGRFVPAIGLTLLGLVFAGAMIAPNIELRFIWPVWLVMTHVIAVGAATHVIGRRSPPLSRRAIVAVIAGWALSSVLLIGAGWLNSLSSDGLWPPWVGPLAPALIGGLILSFVIVATRRVLRLGPGQRAAEKVGRYGALWMSLYTVAWTLGQGLIGPAAILGGLTLAGFLGMTALREAYNLAEHPLGYRR